MSLLCWLKGDLEIIDTTVDPKQLTAVNDHWNHCFCQKMKAVSSSLNMAIEDLPESRHSKNMSSNGQTGQQM